MAFYEDLSPYNYHHYSEQELNVGWLQKDQPFSIGTVPEGFLSRLQKYAERAHIIFQTKGWHKCEFCEDNAHSSNEIRVVSESGIVYACPTLVIHLKKEALPYEDFECVDTP